MMRLLLSVFMFIAAAMPAFAAPPTKAELFAKSAEAISICMDKMPDSKATRAALRAAGFRKEMGPEVKTEYFSALGYRVVVAATLTQNKVAGCAVLFANATPDDAQALLQPAIIAAKAEPIAPPKRVGADRAWLGTFKGGPRLIFVDDYVSVGPLRGALAVARSID